MRGAAVISVYVYGETEEDLKQEALKVAKELREKNDNQAKVVELYKTNYAILETEKIKL